MFVSHRKIQDLKLTSLLRLPASLSLLSVP
jgi:hypothetical protein